MKHASNLLSGNVKHSAKINKIAATKAEILVSTKIAVATIRNCLLIFK